MKIEKFRVSFQGKRPKNSIVHGWGIWHKNWKKPGYVCRWNIGFWPLHIVLAIKRGNT